MCRRCFRFRGAGLRHRLKDGIVLQPSWHESMKNYFWLCLVCCPPTTVRMCAAEDAAGTVGGEEEGGKTATRRVYASTSPAATRKRDSVRVDAAPVVCCDDPATCFSVRRRRGSDAAPIAPWGSASSVQRMSTAAALLRPLSGLSPEELAASAAATACLDR